MPQAGVERCSKQPKAAKFGRQNPLCARWNIPEQLLDWREAWADAMNRVITAEREQALFRERRVDDTAISLAERIVNTEIQNVYSTPKQQNISRRHNEKFR